MGLDQSGFIFFVYQHSDHDLMDTAVDFLNRLPTFLIFLVL